jgi:hypothetical protein
MSCTARKMTDRSSKGWPCSNDPFSPILTAHEADIRSTDSKATGRNFWPFVKSATCVLSIPCTGSTPAAFLKKPLTRNTTSENTF